MRHEREVKLGVRAGCQLGQRREVGLLLLILRHGEGDEAHRAAGRGDDRVQHADLQRQRLGLLEMLMPVVPVTQVQPGRDIAGHLVHAADQARDDRVEAAWAVAAKTRLKDPELHCNIPLHGHLAVRDRRKEPVQVGEHCPFVGTQ